MLSIESFFIYYHKVQNSNGDVVKQDEDYSMLRVFECVTYYHVNDSKLELTSKKKVIVGYGIKVKTFKV